MKINYIYQYIRAKHLLKYSIISLIVLIVLTLIIRNNIAQSIFSNRCLSINKKYGLKINAEKIGFSGVRTLYVNNLSIIPEGRDTIFKISRGEVRLDIMDLILFKINPVDIKLANPCFNFIGHKSTSNYSFLYSKKDTGAQEAITSKEVNQFIIRHKAIYRALKGIFGLTTASYEIDNFVLSYSDSTYNARIIVPKFVSNRKGFDANVELQEGGSTQFINLKGVTSKRKSSVSVNASMSGDRMPLPIISHKLGINLSFDTLDFKLISKQLTSDYIELQLKSSVVKLDVYTKRLSDQLVKIKSGGLNLDLRLTPEYYQVDSTSSVELNGLKSSLFLKYQPSDNRLLQFKIATGTFPSQHLFDALPNGLFNNLRGIKTNGDLNFTVDFLVKLDKPDSIYLMPTLKTKGFGITQYGNRNFSTINDTFSHEVYDDGYYIRTIFLGSQSKDFKSLNQISPLIVNAIVTSEDGGFFYNSGFDIDAFKYAISENLKQKRFVRGGSTITMQLVKNLYLNKNKNLFRKAEEYMIVWLIGSQGIVSKERMLEIYLNIIEWGPNIYGVSEACQYYFKKSPNEVTLDEAIFLASVVPRPKKFKYLFEPDGNLKSFMEADFNFVANKMLLRGMISEEQFSSLKYNVELTGDAKEQLKNLQLVPIDSIFQDELRIVSDSTLLSAPKDVN